MHAYICRPHDLNYTIPRSQSVILCEEDKKYETPFTPQSHRMAECTPRTENRWQRAALAARACACLLFREESAIVCLYVHTHDTTPYVPDAWEGSIINANHVHYVDESFIVLFPLNWAGMQQTHIFALASAQQMKHLLSFAYDPITLRTAIMSFFPIQMMLFLIGLKVMCDPIFVRNYWEEIAAPPQDIKIIFSYMMIHATQDNLQEVAFKINRN